MQQFIWNIKDFKSKEQYDNAIKWAYAMRPLEFPPFLYDEKEDFKDYANNCVRAHNEQLQVVKLLLSLD